MDGSDTTEETPHVGLSTKRLAHRIFVILENRFQLLTIELQQERERVVVAILTAVLTAIFALLAGVTLTFIVALAFWDHSPLIALGVLALIYLAAAAACYAKLKQFQKDWETLPDTIEQLKKDRECLEKHLG